MKIDAIKTQIIEIPFENTITTAIHTMRSVGCVLLTIKTDMGISGEGYLFSLNAKNIKIYHERLSKVASLLIGQDPLLMPSILKKVNLSIDSIGRDSISIAALSTLDTALWDINGKSSNLPLHRLFGIHRTKIKTYASGGLWLSQSIDSIVDEAQKFLNQGFLAMKIRVGSGDSAMDTERVRELRAAISPQVELMADVNQGLSVDDAIHLGKALEEYDLVWLEEPVKANDYKGHAQVKEQVSVPIASCENEYSIKGIHEMLKAKGCDIVMPDLQRIGGISEMRATAQLANSFNVPISTHIFTEQSLCVAGSVENCISVEHMPWFSELFNEKIDIIDGYIMIPERPGTGFTFNKGALKQFNI
jgi:L-alanine-DL-glutamate epimerase-like enolase superfamily enzyme